MHCRTALSTQPGSTERAAHFVQSMVCTVITAAWGLSHLRCDLGLQLATTLSLTHCLGLFHKKAQHFTLALAVASEQVRTMSFYFGPGPYARTRAMGQGFVLMKLLV